MRDQTPISEGTFLYVLGLVIVASHSGRFWLGFGLAAIPVMVGALGKAVSAGRWSGRHSPSS